MTELEDIPGVSPMVARKLRAARITTVELLAVQLSKDIRARTSISEATAEKIIENARALVDKYQFKTGLEIEEEEKDRPRLLTGIGSLDNLLIGGFEIGSLIEIYGRASSGKTQMCYHLAVRAQMALDDGGLACSVLWLDTEKSFKTKVIRANAMRWGLDPDKVLKNIRRVEVVDTKHTNSLFERIPQLCAEENVQLVVIDSLTGQFRQEYKGSDRLIARQQSINSMLNLMRRTASATDASFLYTNQTVSKSGVGQFTSHAPVGGNITAHGSDYRLMMTTVESGGRMISLKDASGIPEFELRLSLGWGGFYEDEYALKKQEPAIREYLASKGYNTLIEREHD